MCILFLDEVEFSKISLRVLFFGAFKNSLKAIAAPDQMLLLDNVLG